MKKYILIILFFSFNLYTHAQDFITRWDLSIPGSGATKLTFGVGTSGTCSYTWETIPAGFTGTGIFTGDTLTIAGLPAGAMIRLKIDTTNFRRIYFDYVFTDRNRLKDVVQWGGVHWSTMENAFSSCQNLNITSIDAPNLSNVASLNSMFQGCSALNGPMNIDSWNTSNVVDMSNLFRGDTLFNQPIGNWNTSNVVNMSEMFFWAFAFNQPIGNWNTSNVLDMTALFLQAYAFNQPIGNWNTDNVIQMGSMFYIATSFNQPIGNWNTSNVVNMQNMFMCAYAFNQPIGNWNTSNVVNMSQMFAYTDSFNQPIGNWNTGSVTNMHGMFENSVAFNQPIGSWNTGNVTNMRSMFSFSNSFDQPIGNWNTSSVTNMGEMFRNTTAFNQPIGNWNTASVVNMEKMFSYSNLFNQPIGNWNTANVTDMSFMFYEALSFNQPIENWNIVSVTNMESMFRNANVFNQSLANWNVSNVLNMQYMFTNAYSFNQSLGNWQLHPFAFIFGLLNYAGLDCNNYSSTLMGWSNNINTPPTKNLEAISLKYYIIAQNDRDYLINIKGWTIFGDALANNNCCVALNNTINITTCNSYFFNGQLLTNTGTYYDSLVNMNGCDSLITLNLIINQADTSVTQSGTSLSANASGASYQWLNCNTLQAITGEINQNYTATVNGEYAVIVTQNGCTDTSACYNVIGIGLNDYYLSNSIKIFPNPVSQNLQIESEIRLQNAEICLLNMMGQTIITYNNISTKKWTVDMSALAPGNYFIQIKDASHSFVKKVHKE